MGVTRVTRVVDDIPQLQRTFVSEFESRAADTIAQRGRFIVAIPGGSVASTMLPPLAGVAVDWARIDIFWIDERAVPPDHPESNYGLAQALLLAPVSVPASRVHRMPAELADLEQAARLSAGELRSVAGDPPRLDLALVGVGEDGHVASIFDVGAGGLTSPAPVAAVYDARKLPARRLTLTLPVLADAARVVVAAFGASKAAVMREALDNRSAALPIAALLRSAPSSLVLLDRDAGQLS